MTYDWYQILGLPPTATVIAEFYPQRGKTWCKVTLSDKAWSLYLLSIPIHEPFDDRLRHIPGLTLQGAAYTPNATLYFTVNEEEVRA
jgi:hypothetical protein